MKQRLAFALIMGSITTGIVSFTVIAANVGFVPTFAQIWTRSWLIGYIVAIPAIVFISPMVMKLVSYLFKERKLLTQKN